MQERVTEIISRLALLYPAAECTLDFKHDYELLFSTRLAAQCTDARVNIVAKELYVRFPSLESIAEADIYELEEIVRPCGFYHGKAKDLKEGALKILMDFDGKVPDNMEDLLSLPGIGRKTANLVLGELYGKPAVVTDTHCIRLSNRLGLTDSKEPYKVELRLQEIVPESEQLLLCHRFVHHGRAVCRAKKPDCGTCVLSDICAFPKHCNQ